MRLRRPKWTQRSPDMPLSQEQANKIMTPSIRWQGWPRMRTQASSISLRCFLPPRTSMMIQSCTSSTSRMRKVTTTIRSNLRWSTSRLIHLTAWGSNSWGKSRLACQSSSTPTRICTCTVWYLSRWSESWRSLASQISLSTTLGRTGSRKSRPVRTSSSTLRH